MARINVSVPDDLKIRMDVIDGVNWSAIAKAAFERELAYQSSIKEIETMEDVVDRLRGSKAQYIEDLSESGKDYGRDWAMNTAEYAELSRITEQVNLGTGPSTKDALFDLINGIEGGVDCDWEEFWERLEVTDESIITEEFIQGFCQGAKAVFDEVKHKL